jgi:hypothetical protein
MVQERTRYLYGHEELAEWTPGVCSLAEQAGEVRVLMNTNYEDLAVLNARQLQMLLEQAKGARETFTHRCSDRGERSRNRGNGATCDARTLMTPSFRCTAPSTTSRDWPRRTL